MQLSSQFHSNLNNSTIPLTEELTTHRTSLKQEGKNHFLSLTRESLPHITFRTRSIDEIWAIMTSLWEKYSLPSDGSTLQLPSSKALETQISLLFQQFTFSSIDTSKLCDNSKPKRNLKRSFSIQSTIDSSLESPALTSSNLTTPTTIPSNTINLNTCK